MKEPPKWNLGDKVKTTVSRYGVKIDIIGTVKERRISYGRYEYLVGDSTTSEFWARSLEEI